MNIYFDASHSALKYLKDTEASINNLLIMTDDFNIRDSLWDSSFSYHSSISDNLIIIMDSFNLELLILTNSVPTRYSDIAGKVNSVIDLMFLQSRSIKLNNYLIHPDLCLISDHTPLTVFILIAEENVNLSKLSISKNSKEEIVFVNEVTTIIKNLNTSNLTDCNKLEDIVNLLASNIKQAWGKNTKQVNITKHSNKWWNKECSQSLDKYRTSRKLKDWKSFKKTVKDTKRSFFNFKIQEITNKSQGPWELMSWINKLKLPAIEVIKYKNQLCFTIGSLWNTLHSTFNTTLYQQINTEVLKKIC